MMKRPEPKRSRNRLLPGAMFGLYVLACSTLGCSSPDVATAPVLAPPDVEEARVDAALIALEHKAEIVTRPLQFAPLASNLSNPTSAAGRSSLLQEAQRIGRDLWNYATADAQKSWSSSASELDDRPLYWRRLLEKREFKARCTASPLCAEALAGFERASRGAGDLQFTDNTDLRIVVSGFDPFSLDRHIDQGNPSGAAALALDGQQITANGVSAEVQSLVFPVRFADFDQGMVEDLLEPLIKPNSAGTRPPLDMLITISMGRANFDLERFPGRRRSAQAPDNLGVRTGANSTAPLVPLLRGSPLAGPEFVEFSLPVAALRTVQTPYAVNDNRSVVTLEGGEQQAQSLDAIANQTAVRGSGGGYLSNEISYRTVHLVRSHNRDIAVGHIHTPRVSGFDAQVVHSISEQIRAMLTAAVAATQ